MNVIKEYLNPNFRNKKKKPEKKIRYPVEVQISNVALAANTPQFSQPKYTASVGEDASPGEVVATVASGAAGTTFTYAIASGNEAGVFALNNRTGDVTLLQEQCASTAPLYTMVLEIRDSEHPGLVGQGLLEVSVDDVNSHAPAFSPVDAAAPFETQRPPAFSPVDAAVETRPPAFSPVEAVAPVETPRPLPLDPRSPPDDDSDGDGDDAPPPWEDPRSPMRAKRDYVDGLGPPAVPPTPHNSRTSLAEDFEVQLPEPVDEKPESDAESDGMRAQQRHLDIWERFLTNAATRKFSGPRRDPAADKLLAAAAGDGYDDAEAARTISELLTEGTAPDASDEQGRRPLHHAAFAMALDRCQLLYDGGADVDASDKGGNRPLHVAAARGATAIVDFLLGCAASVDASNDDGDRPLHLSAWMGHADATARLIEGEANVDALNGQGYDPLDNILERSPCVAKQRARLLAGKRPKPLPGPLRATVQLLEEVRVRRSGAVVEEL